MKYIDLKKYKNRKMPENIPDINVPPEDERPIRFWSGQPTVAGDNGAAGVGGNGGNEVYYWRGTDEWEAINLSYPLDINDTDASI